MSTDKNDSPERLSRQSSSRIRIQNLINPSGREGSSSSNRRPESSTALTVPCTFSGCKRKFPSQEALVAHRKRVHMAPTDFKCPHCHVTFSSPQNRNKHVCSAGIYIYIYIIGVLFHSHYFVLEFCVYSILIKMRKSYIPGI